MSIRSQQRDDLLALGFWFFASAVIGGLIGGAVVCGFAR